MPLTARAAVALAIAVTAACGGPTKLGDPGGLPTTRDAFGGPTRCSDTAEPDLAGWDSHARGLLANQRKFGIIVVRYEVKDGCNVELEVLPNCIAELRDTFGKIVRYDYGPYFASEKKVLHDKNELFANMPLGAVSLQGSVGQGQSLRTDLSHVGIAALPPDTLYRRGDLRGSECTKATHVVSRVYLGAFAMQAGNTRELEAATTVFGAGAAGKSNAQRGVAREEGDLNECTAAKSDGKERAACAVPLRLGLATIEGGAGQSTAASPAPAGDDDCSRACRMIGEQCKAANAASSSHAFEVEGCIVKCNRTIADKPSCKAESDAFLACVLKQDFAKSQYGCPAGFDGIVSPTACDPAEEKLKRCRHIASVPAN